MKKNDEAKSAFVRAQEVMKSLIIQEIKATGGSTSIKLEDATVEQLTQPSIFDTDRIKDLKS